MPEIELKEVLDEAKKAAAALDAQKKAFEELKSDNDENLKQRDVVLEEKLGRINDDMGKFQETLDKFELSMKRPNVKHVDADGNEIDLDQKAFDWAKSAAARRQEQIDSFTNEDLNKYKSAFVRYARKGDAALSVDEVKALSVGSDPDGGYLVNPDMTGRIVQKVFETSPMRAFASIQVISTDALEGMYDLEEAAYGWVGETESRAVTDTPQIGKWRIPVHEMYAKPQATQKLLDDADVDVEAWLAAKVADRFARVEAAAFITGDGVGKPRGITTYTEGTTIPGQIEVFNTGVNGGFKADPDGGHELLDVIYGLKEPYRANARFFMNRTTLGAVRLLQDSEGNYQWQPGLQLGQPSTILGYPVASFEDMPTYSTTGALAVGFGDLREAYQIVERHGIRTLRDPYSNKPYVQFYSIKRVGGDVVNFEAVKFIKFAT